MLLVKVTSAENKHLKQPAMINKHDRVVAVAVLVKNPCKIDDFSLPLPMLRLQANRYREMHETVSRAYPMDHIQ